MQNGDINNNQLSASSSLAPNARLHGPTAWCPDPTDTDPVVVITLEGSQYVSGVTLQGKSNSGNWVSRYRVSFSRNMDHAFIGITDGAGNIRVFDGNSDEDTTVTRMFDAPVQARWIQIEPVAWHGDICLRFELLGCYMMEGKEEPGNPSEF